MDKLLAELEKIEGAADLAVKLREAWATADADATKAALVNAEKKLAKAEKDRDKFKADAEAASKGQDLVVAAQAERDTAKAERDAATTALSSFKLTTKLERKLGISNEVKSRRAVAALLEAYGEEVTLDDKGEVVGADKALEAFKVAESFWFDEDAEGEPTKPANGGPRAGAGPNPVKLGGKAPQTHEEKRAARKAEMLARQKGK